MFMGRNGKSESSAQDEAQLPVHERILQAGRALFATRGYAK